MSRRWLSLLRGMKPGTACVGRTEDIFERSMEGVLVSGARLLFGTCWNLHLLPKRQKPSLLLA